MADRWLHTSRLTAPVALPPGRVLRRINAERVALFGWSRAILMQLAHPLIAAGVAEHSTFRRGAVGAAARLHHTIRTMLALTFGDEARRQHALDTIAAIHCRVHGVLRETAGVFPAGSRYSAEDPALVLWVHVTLLDSIPLVYEALVERLTDAERDAYCDEAAGLAIALGADPAAVPRTAAAVRESVESMLASDVLTVTGAARDLVAAVLRPPLAWLTGPAVSTNRHITIGLLPASLRRAYGFPWAPADERAFEAAMRRVRRVRAVLPRTLALWPEARSGPSTP